MERAEDPQPKTGISPIKAFLILAGVLAAIAAAIYLTRPDTPSTTATPTQTPDFSLTDEEAIGRFHQLDQLKIQMYRDRDFSLIPEIYTRDSKVRGLVEKDLQKLRSDGVLFRTRFGPGIIDMLRSNPDEIVLIQKVVVHPRYVSESGEDLTPSDADERQTVRVTLHLEDGQWKVFDSVVTEAEPLPL